MRRAPTTIAILSAVLAAGSGSPAVAQSEGPTPAVPIPTPREVAEDGLATLGPVPPADFPDRVSAWVDRHLAVGAGEPPERARERRRSFLVGAGAVFDAGDTLAGLPLVGRAFAGLIREEEKPLRDAICARARLHGRHDAPKHFFIAAALAARGGPAAAAQASLVKEIEDARRFDADPPDGSGFSYLDLAYDHAGIRFAAWLLGWRDDTRLARPAPSIAAFLPVFPELELPERIGWQRYVAEYRGDRTTAFIERIHRAIDERQRAHGVPTDSGETPVAPDGEPLPADPPPTERNGESP